MKKLQRQKPAQRFPKGKQLQVDVPLDALDRRILQILQRDSLIPNLALAGEIGLSPPACLKRVRRLRDAGIIGRTVALLSPEALGYPLLTVARVKLDHPTEKVMAEFEARWANMPRVMHCFTVTGDIDYILLIRSRDVAHYQEFARRILVTAPGIRSYTSEIVLAVNKSTTEIPIDSA